MHNSHSLSSDELASVVDCNSSRDSTGGAEERIGPHRCLVNALQTQTRSEEVYGNIYNARVNWCWRYLYGHLIKYGKLQHPVGSTCVLEN